MRENCALLVSLILQVCAGQQQEFNFPDKIQALLGSCVEIPCSRTSSPTEAQNIKVVWHVKPAPLGERIIYSTDVLQISPNYRKRAELVRLTTADCTLRIYNVERQDRRSYYPQERKLSILKSVSKYVQLEVTERPPDPVLSIPGEITLGETTTITCMANYTCASSPPIFNWNLIGPHVTEKSDLGDGKWKATSKLAYKPSEEGKDLIIVCTVTYFGGKIVIAMDKITIQADQNVADHEAGETANQYIGPIIGVICIILLLAIVFILWRKRKSFLPRKKTENCGKLNPLQNTSKNNSKYTDLLERQMSSYYTLEPTALSHVPRPGRPVLQASQNEPIYEDMTKTSKLNGEMKRSDG